MDDCSFDIPRGKVTALIGPNGSGKTTLFNMICGVAPPDAGEIQLEGTELVGRSVDAIARLGVSRMYQRSRLFQSLTVRENLLLACGTQEVQFWESILRGSKTTRALDDRCAAILETFSLGKILHTPVRQLSFGQKRIVELARALLAPHALLLLDEPVAGVHPKVRHDIEVHIHALREAGATILLIEHDMGFTMNVADAVLVMDAGRIISRGTPKEVLNDPKVQEAYLGT